MHRVALSVALTVLAACGAPPPVLPDPPRVEALRAQITKARNAIAETRIALTRNRGTPHEAELWVRLAELIGEEARYHYQVAKAREGDAKALHVPQVRVLKGQAIDLYARVLRDWPDGPNAPRAWFNLGQEHRELGDYPAMREALGQLVTRFPADPLAAEALIVLGDDHFDRGEMAAAGKAYQRITKGPPSRTVGLALYKLGWVRVNEGDCAGALTAFEQAIDRTRALEGRALAGATIDVRREALVDLVYCYSRERAPDQAAAYLRARAHGRAAYVAALERMADRFGVMDQALGALSVARELLDVGPDDPQRLEDARLLHGAIRKTGRYQTVGEDATRIAAVVRRHLRRTGLTADQRARTVDEFEAIVRDLGTRGQEALFEARRGDAVDPALAAQVAQAYRAHLAAFPAAKSRGAVVQNLADVLSAADADFEAGRWYLASAQAQPGTDLARKALYDAVVHFQTALQAPAGERSRVERVLARAQLRRAGGRLLAEGRLTADQARKVKFAIARSWYDQGQLREAGDRLEAVAFEAAGTAEGDAAVDLLLDAYSTRNDFLGLIDAGRRLAAADSPVSPAVKARIGPIVQAAEQQQLDELSLAAAGDEGGDPQAELAAFADRFKGTALGERALLNAFVAARAAGDTAAMAALAGRIEREYPQSTQLAGLLAALGRAAAARFELDRAVAVYARAAALPGPDQVALATAAGQLRLQLGDGAGALAEFGQALKAVTEPAQRAEPAARIADWAARYAPPAEAIAQLKPLASAGDPRVWAVLGLAQVRAGQLDDGEATLQRVVERGAGVAPAILATALYGQAEALAKTLLTFEPGDDIDAVTELVTLVEVTEQAYLKAAREADPAVTAAALGRWAYVAGQVATRLGTLAAPSALSGEQAARFKAGLAARADGLRTMAGEALSACATQAWSRSSFGPPARACLSGKAPAQDALTMDALGPRRPAAANATLDDLRARVAKNPEDVAALRALGEALLAAGDAHAARLPLAAAVRAGGGAEELNALGLAQRAAGDIGGGLSSFARAAAGGLEAGRQNLADALRQAGLAAAADEALTRYPQGRAGGARLGGTP